MYLRDLKTGLSTLQYTVESTREIEVEGVAVTVINAVLTCDLNTTPWCIKQQQYDEVGETNDVSTDQTENQTDQTDQTD